MRLLSDFTRAFIQVLISLIIPINMAVLCGVSHVKVEILGHRKAKAKESFFGDIIFWLVLVWLKIMTV